MLPTFLIHAYNSFVVAVRARVPWLPVPQLSDHQQQWAQTSRAKAAAAESPADGLSAVVLPHVGRRRSGGGGGSGETGGVSPSSAHRGNLGRLLRSSSERGEDGTAYENERKVLVITNQDQGGHADRNRNPNLTSSMLDSVCLVALKSCGDYCCEDVCYRLRHKRTPPLPQTRGLLQGLI